MDLLDMGQTLGKGAYGKVYKGKLKLGPDLRVEVSKTAGCLKTIPSENIAVVRLR